MNTTISNDNLSIFVNNESVLLEILAVLATAQSMPKSVSFFFTSQAPIPHLQRIFASVKNILTQRDFDSLSFDGQFSDETFQVMAQTISNSAFHVSHLFINFPPKDYTPSLDRLSRSGLLNYCTRLYIEAPLIQDANVPPIFIDACKRIREVFFVNDNLTALVLGQLPMLPDIINGVETPPGSPF